MFLLSSVLKFIKSVFNRRIKFNFFFLSFYFLKKEEKMKKIGNNFVIILKITSKNRA